MEQKQTIQQEEEQVLSFWKKNKIYEKSKKQNEKGKKFYFMDGPPYATGHIHMGTALNKILKDIAMRSQRLQGKNVFDRAGYDTHGVPIELKIERQIGSRGKQDIEKYGVKKFINECKKFATQYIDVMNEEFIDLGVWMNFSNPYITLENSYIEAIWNTFKEADKKKLLYLGKYPVHVCPRCETAVAFNEIEYGKQKDMSIFVKFPLKKQKNTYLIIWTTTPWTLPGNTGVMVNPNVTYQEIETGEGEKWIIAKDLAPKLMEMVERGYTTKKEFTGKEMDGWEYISPLAKYISLKTKNAYKVVLSSRYVTTEEGTGLVHCAPGHGKEDFEVGLENNLDAPCPVNTNGILTEEAGKYAGKKARIVDEEIISDLEKDRALVHKIQYEHDYPLCWRDKTPLLMLSQPQWFFKISKIKSKLLEHNEKVNWIPKYMQLRMKAWLEGINDWPVSRQRYWGTPLPIWVNEKNPDDYIVIGSIKELEKLSKKKIKEIHKPEIDEIIIKKENKTYKRITEVLDVWFDSGVSSWATLGYPQSSVNFKKFWPADLNIEGRDQFRGWWNSQLILSEITFGKKPYENIAVHGMVLDLGKTKMSKSVGNIITPQEIIKKYGRDYIRYYFAKLSKGEDFAYDEKEFQEIRKIINLLNNINTFVNQLQKKKSSSLAIEDKWIISKYNSFIKNATESYNKYKFPDAVNEFELFITTLSRQYIQLIRDRADETQPILDEIRQGTLKLLAPITPFLTEKLWKELVQNKIVKEKSIHLSALPLYDNKKINTKLEKEVEQVFDIIAQGLRIRDKSQIGLRWPLAKATINCKTSLSKELKGIIKRQLNIKNIILKVKPDVSEITVELDKKQTPELLSEGFSREIIRAIQSERKKQGFEKSQLIPISLSVSKELKQIISPFAKIIKKKINAKTLEITELTSTKNQKISTIKGKHFSIAFRR